MRCALSDCSSRVVVAIAARGYPRERARRAPHAHRRRARARLRRSPPRPARRATLATPRAAIVARDGDQDSGDASTSPAPARTTTHTAVDERRRHGRHRRRPPRRVERRRRRGYAQRPIAHDVDILAGRVTGRRRAAASRERTADGQSSAAAASTTCGSTARTIGNVCKRARRSARGDGKVILNTRRQRPSASSHGRPTTSASPSRALAEAAEPTPTPTPHPDRRRPRRPPRRRPTCRPRRTRRRAPRRQGRRASPRRASSSRLTSGGYAFPVVRQGARGRQLRRHPRRADRHPRGRRHLRPFGSPVVAVRDGTISHVGTLPISGNRLWLRTANGDAFFYAHLSAFSDAARNGAQGQGRHGARLRRQHGRRRADAAAPALRGPPGGDEGGPPSTPTRSSRRGSAPTTSRPARGCSSSAPTPPSARGRW